MLLEPGRVANVPTTDLPILSALLEDELAFELIIVATRAQLLTKRAIDITLSAFLLLCCLPLFALAAIAVRLSSPGPILYRQERVGQRGQVFTVLKFRSMRADAEQQRQAYVHLNEAKGPVFKIRKDPRITPVGVVLRRTSIDELPQLLNVLRGEMSLVGPRPPLPHEYATYTAKQRARLRVKPGLTCVWQVSGRSNIAFEDWIEMDLRYIQTWNLRRDLLLLLRTIPAVLLGRGAW